MNALIEERQTTHGDFSDTARVTQAIKAALESGPHYAHATDVGKEAAAMIASKLARIVCGDPRFKDHWVDIAGYAGLAGNE